MMVRAMPLEVGEEERQKALLPETMHERAQSLEMLGRMIETLEGCAG